MQPNLVKPSQTTSQEAQPVTENSSPPPNLDESFGSGSSVPPTQSQIPPLSADSPKKSMKRMLILVVFILVVAGSSALALIFTKKDNASLTPASSDNTTVQPISSAAKTPFLFISNAQSHITILADANGKQIYSTPVSGSYEAASPGKQVLVSSYDNDTQLSTFTLIGKDGKIVPINQAAQKTMGDKKNVNRTFVMLQDNIVLEAVCTNAGSKDNNCKILQINLVSGEQKTLLETTAPIPFTTGESIFNFVGNSSDNKVAYIQANGPTKLGESASAVYNFDPTSSKTTLLYEFPKDRDVENLSVSHDSKKLIYSMQGGGSSSEGSATIYTVKIATKKENALIWNEEISGGAYPFVWSQDNNKVSAVGFKLVTGQISSIGPLTLAYINFEQNKITNLQTIEDSAHQNIEKLYWLDSSTLAYGIDNTNNPHNFSSSTGQVFKQDLNVKTGTVLNAPAGHLERVIFW
jgi:hypothetical protein